MPGTTSKTIRANKEETWKPSATVGVLRPFQPVPPSACFYNGPNVGFGPDERRLDFVPKR